METDMKETDMIDPFAADLPTSLSVVPPALVLGVGLLVMAGVALARRAKAAPRPTRYAFNAAAFLAAGVTQASIGAVVLVVYQEVQTYHLTGGFPIGGSLHYLPEPVLGLPVVIIAGVLVAVMVAGLLSAISRTQQFQTAVAIVAVCIAVTVFFGSLALRYDRAVWLDLMDVAWMLVIGSGFYFLWRCVVAYGDRRVANYIAAHEGVQPRELVH